MLIDTLILKSDMKHTTRKKINVGFYNFPFILEKIIQKKNMKCVCDTPMQPESTILGTIFHMTSLYKTGQHRSVSILP